MYHEVFYKITLVALYINWAPEQTDKNNADSLLSLFIKSAMISC